MRIVTRQQLMALPAGTVYGEYEPCVYSGMMLKGESWETDWLFQELVGAVAHGGGLDYVDACYAMQDGESIPADFDCYDRDGMFDDAQLYWIYEPADLDRLIATLQRARRQAEDTPDDH